MQVPRELVYVRRTRWWEKLLAALMVAVGAALSGLLLSDMGSR